MTTQIIGCGNLRRGDDAAGVLVAKRLRELGIEAEIQSGGAFELLASWDHHERVILIDAVVTGSRAGAIHVWEGHPPYLPQGRQFSSHGFGLEEAIRLAQVLNSLPKDITVYGIEGESFAIGDAVSPEVLAAVERVVQQIAHACGRSSASEARKVTHSAELCP